MCLVKFYSSWTPLHHETNIAKLRNKHSKIYEPNTLNNTLMPTATAVLNRLNRFENWEHIKHFPALGENHSYEKLKPSWGYLPAHGAYQTSSPSRWCSGHSCGGKLYGEWYDIQRPWLAISCHECSHGCLLSTRPLRTREQYVSWSALERWRAQTHAVLLAEYHPLDEMQVLESKWI